MSHIGRQIEFSSPAFPPCEEDKQLVNHASMHGYALARYVAERLPDHGFELGAMVPEDWGWWCEVRNEGFALGYACGTQDDAGNDAPENGGENEGGGEDFMLFVMPDKPRIRR